MQDFIILTYKASAQFRDILEWPDATEYALRRILIGSLKESTVISVSGKDPVKEMTHLVEIVNRWVKKNILIKISRNINKLSPDGTMVCCFVKDICEVDHQIQVFQPTKAT